MAQIGTEVLVKSAPVFTDFKVESGTWKEQDDTQLTRSDGGDDLVFNYITWRPGVVASCTWTILAGKSPAKVGGVVAESGGDSPRSFIVTAATTTTYGGQALKQDVTLAYHEGFTATAPGGGS